MNLLTEKWLPIIRQSGQTDWISPCDITSKQADDPVMAFHSHRPDFDAALIQFMIGLLQTAYHPVSTRIWDSYYEKPPTPEQLQETFNKLLSAFEFSNTHPAFMQDFTTLEGEKKSVSSLLIEQPGEQTLKFNTDHFVKRNIINQLCYACAATALFTLQINAPSGGAGHRTSLRGGGPLTTLILSEENTHKSLWNMLWLNVITDFDDDNQKNNMSDIFPWLALTRTSDDKQGGVSTTPVDTNSLQMYWCMPRRIRLDFNNLKKGECDICHRGSLPLVIEYSTQNYGINYKSGWKHPLSPHYYDADGMPIPYHPQPGGIPYKYWANFSAATMPKEIADKEKKPSESAAVMTTLRNRIGSHDSAELKLWIFGYDMDNMKARCWYEAKMPLYGELLKKASDVPKILIEGAEKVLGYTRIAIKNAWFSSNSSAKGSFDFISLEFWSKTESAFYEKLVDINKNKDEIDIKEQWLIELQTASKDLFSKHTASRVAENKRCAKASKQLNKNLNGPKIRQVLDLKPKDKTRGKDECIE